jgi:hypothetical protein
MHAQIGLAACNFDPEVAASERGVEHHALRARLLDLGQRSGRGVGRVHDAAGVRRTQVGQDIAVLEGIQQQARQLGHTVGIGARVADVDHQWQVVLARDVTRQADHRIALLVHDRAHQAQFQALDQTGVSLDAGRNCLAIDVLGSIDISAGHCVRKAADIQEHQDARPRVGQDVVLEDADIRHPHRTTVQDGRDARLHAGHVWLEALHAHAGRLRAVCNVGVDIDQAGHHVTVVPTDLDGPRRLADRYVRLDCGNLAVTDADVQRAVQVLPRIEHVAAFDQYVVGHQIRTVAAYLISSSSRVYRQACLRDRLAAPTLTCADLAPATVFGEKRSSR